MDSTLLDLNPQLYNKIIKHQASQKFYNLMYDKNYDDILNDIVSVLNDSTVAPPAFIRQPQTPIGRHSFKLP